MRKQRVVLEHHADVAPARRKCGDVAPRHEQRAGAGLDVPGADVEQRRLAGAGRSEEADELAGGDFEIERTQRLEAP